MTKVRAGFELQLDRTGRLVVFSVIFDDEAAATDFHDKCAQGMHDGDLAMHFTATDGLQPSSHSDLVQ